MYEREDANPTNRGKGEEMDFLFWLSMSNDKITSRPDGSKMVLDIAVWGKNSGSQGKGYGGGGERVEGVCWGGGWGMVPSPPRR